MTATLLVAQTSTAVASTIGFDYHSLFDGFWGLTIEGLTYVWSPAELVDVLGEGDGQAAAELPVDPPRAIGVGGGGEGGGPGLGVPAVEPSSRSADEPVGGVGGVDGRGERQIGRLGGCGDHEHLARRCPPGR